MKKLLYLFVLISNIVHSQEKKEIKGHTIVPKKIVIQDNIERVI